MDLKKKENGEKTLRDFDGRRRKRMIDKQCPQLAELRERAVSISTGADGMPKQSASGSKTERAVEQLAVAEARLAHLEKRLYQAIESVPDEYIRKMIRCLTA